MIDWDVMGNTFQYFFHDGDRNMEKWKKIGKYATDGDIEARGNKRRVVDSNGKVLIEYISKSGSEEISE